ncbi:hypothetical protein [Sporomusa aerivorans]|uniref:hypothetical protein n=1 Tax=Sporomusa aerivorans TaxID=204936 RepID=UPI00352B8304
MVHRHKKRYTKKNLAAAVLLSCLLSSNQVLGAELAAVVPSDFHNSQLGILSGSRVTAYIDPASATMKIDELNRDPSVFAINYNGQSRLLLRQYTYSTTELKAVTVINPVKTNWIDYVNTGELKSVPNIHAAATYGDYLYATDYDFGNIAVANLSKAILSENEHHSLKEDAAKVTGIHYDDKTTFHGEGLVVKDNYLYAITSVNLDGGYDKYDDGYLLQYVIKSDGSLVAVDAQRIGKNTFNVHPFNDTLFTCSSGGYQQMGYPNAETAIHAVNINNGNLNSSRKITIPAGVKGEYRDMAITNDGTAYVFGGYYDASYGGIIGNVYKTTVTNLLADKPVAWEKVIEINDWPGFNWDIEVESNPRRLWFLAGNKLQIYQDGSTKPLEFAASQFATKEGLNQFNSWGFAFITPDSVANGNSKTMQLEVNEGLTSPTATISKTIILPELDASSNGTNAISGTPDYTTRIMGLQQYNNGTGIEYTDTEYQTKGVTTDFKTYKFNKDTILGLKASAEGDYKTNILAAVFARYGQDITVDAGTHALTLNVENNAGNPTGIYAGNGKNVTVNAGQLNINTATYANGEMVTNAIWNDAAKDTASSITINAPVHITMAGGQGGNGIAVTKKDRWGEGSAEATAKSRITINGDVTIAGTDGSWGVPLNSQNVYSRFNSAGLYTSVDNSEIDVNGKVDLTVYGNGIATVAKDSKITVDGGHIAVPSGKNYGYYTLASYLGTINMNTGDAGNLPGTEDVRLDGDIFALKTGTVNVGLTTANSYLKGIVDNGGTVNMWLQNGATWTDRAQNTRYTDDNEDIGSNGASHITNLYGGSSSAGRGVIFPENDKGITIDKYTGNLLAIYEHDTSDPTKIKGGSITITSAGQTNGQNAVMTLRTDNAGINTADTSVVSNVLNALSGKLTYTNYKNGERYLDGKVEIAEGLTAQSAVKFTGTVAFDSASGKGSYGTGAPEPPTGQTKTEFTTTLTGVKAKDTEYENGGVLKDNAYAFTKDSTITTDDGDVTAGNIGYYKAVAGILGSGNDITVNAADKTLGITAASTGSSNQAIGIYANKNLKLTAKDVRIASTSAGQTAYGIFLQDGGQGDITGNVSIQARHTGAGSATGIYLYNSGSKLTIHGDLTMKGNGTGDDAYGIISASKGGYGTPVWQAKGIYIYDTAGAELLVTGNADIAVKGTGVDMRGSKNNKVTIGGGSIITPESSTDDFKALSIAAGTFNMGMNDGDTDVSGKNVAVTGEVYVLKDGKVNLGLGSAGSSFTGVVDNYDGGAVNLYLKNGGTWTNKATSSMLAFGGSRISSLAGGSSAGGQGYIYQQDSNDITIDKYSGYASVWYDHEAANPTAIKGGNLRITSAAAGSAITLRTDNGGLNTSSTAAADKNKVSETLNALANKLYYTGYKTEGNLTGKVEIAEGLTAQSASRTETITYKEGGQGQYEFTPAVEPEKGAITKNTVLTEDRLAEATEKNAQGPSSSLLVSALYSDANTSRTNPMVVDLNGHNLTLNAAGDQAILAGLYAGTNQYIEIKNTQADKKLVIHAAHSEDTRAANGIYVSGNAHLSIAGPVEIDGIYTKGDSVAGIAIQGAGSAGGGAGSEVTINGPLTIKNITAERGRGNGINAAGIRVTADASKVIVNDAVDITGIKGSGLYTVGADTEISVGGGTITAAADADHTKQYYAARADKGTININMNGDKAGEKTVKLTGDLYVTREYGQKVVEYSGGQLVDFDNKGVLNVALTGKDSFWTGAATYVADRSDYGTGGFTAHDAGTFNLYLQNGAMWTNEVQSGTSDQLQTFQGSHLASLAGGSSAGGQGYIYQKDSRDITIDKYSGYTSVWYDHEAANPTNIKGGDLRISSAAAGSAITLRTDNGGLNTSSTAAADKNKVSETLNALASKLYYTGYKTEGNLTGKVEIAEGLTSQSASRTETLTYREGGQGQYEYTPAIDIPDSQNKIKFITAITGERTADAEYVAAGVKKDNGSYVFTADKTTLTPAKHLIAAGAWMPQISSAISGSTADKSVSINLNNKELTINTVTDTHTTGITAIGDGQVEINNAGKITIQAESTSGGQTAALYANGGGHIVIHNGGDNPGDKVLTLRADTTAKANGAVIKAMNGVSGKESSIIIDGLVDVIADGDTTDGKGANEAISAVASTIDIGGGSIKAINDAWCAIRAYGEFVSNNYGTVNVNVVKDSGGNVIGAGKNKTVIEGNIVTNGGMGTKGRVSIGLSTADSYWKGDYTDVTGYGVTPGQLGNVNLFMSNGANWTGYTKGTMNVTMASGATWNGYNIGDNFALNLSDGAIWYNTNTTADNSKIKYFIGSTGTGKTGYIDMTTIGAGNVVIDNYSGSTTVLYKHDETTPTSISGGGITITSADKINGANAVITLRTDNTGINTADEDAVTAVLDALAGKLTYTSYTQGERNLNGYVQIAEGLTAQSAAKQTGDIAFSETDGTGNLKEGSLQPGYTYPGEQSKETFTSAITGNAQTDKEYKRNGVLQSDGTYKFTKQQTSISLESAGEAAVLAKDNAVTIDMGKNKLVINNKFAAADTAVSGMAATAGHRIVVNNAGAVAINAQNSDGEAAGLYASGANSSIAINNDNAAAKAVTITGSAKNNQYTGIKASDGGSVTVTGLVDITAAEAIHADSGSVSIGGGTLSSAHGTAIRVAGSGSVNINVTGSGDDMKTAGNKVVVNGDILLQNNTLARAAAAAGAGTVNLGLSGKDSSWTGAADQQGGVINLILDKGAAWTNQAVNSGLTGSRINKLIGGDSDSNRGVIIQKDNSSLSIGSYSGHTLAVFGHDAGDPTKIIGGAITIESAERTNGKDASMTLRVDNDGINTADSDKVEAVLAALANKLNYTNYTDQRLAGSVEIAEGLTSAAVAKRGTVIFADSSTGSLKNGSIISPAQPSDPEIIYGSKETAMMRGAKTAMTSSILAWRAENSDLGERLGDLRKTADQDGIWARVYSGENKYDKDNTNYSNNFKTVQIGYDRPVGNSGWHAGGALSYMDGDSKYELGGRGDNKAYSLALYGTWLGDGGEYLDLVLKGSKLKNEYTVYNDMRHKLAGDYDNWGTSLSVEYGKRISRNNGFYVEPQAQLTYARLNSAGYNAHSDFGGGKDMHVEQGGMNSLVGRLGIGIGKNSDRSGLYAKVSLAHEFCGDMTTAFSAVNEPTSSVSQDFGDTWWEFNIGGNRMIGKNTYLYADLTKTVGGDIDVKWKANAGLRWTF